MHFPIHPRCVHCSAVLNHVGGKLVLELKRTSGNLSVQFRQRRTGGIKHHDTIFGGCPETLVGGSEWVPDLSRRNTHGLQGRNVTRNGGGIRGTVTPIVKATSKVKDGHSSRLCNEGAAVVGESWGCGEDGVGGVLVSNHVGVGGQFIPFGRAVGKEQSIVIWNARGVEGGRY